MEKRLYRDEFRKKIGGVCAGLAEYFEIDVAIVRALFIITFFAGGSSFLVYFVLWVVLPKRSVNFFNPGVDYRVQPDQAPFNPFDANRSANAEAPFTGIPQKKSSTPAAIIIGTGLILFGMLFLLHELGILYFWHVAKLWPIALVLGGLAMIVSGQKKQPWEKEGWQDTATEPDVTPANDTMNKEETKDDNITNTPPTI
jgi:phage shock protein C